MMLCGNSLPWVKSTRHLGNKIKDKIDVTRQDMREKRSQFIQKNNEICQEISFADLFQGTKLIVLCGVKLKIVCDFGRDRIILSK